jgi:hypothetical protein
MPLIIFRSTSKIVEFHHVGKKSLPHFKKAPLKIVLLAALCKLHLKIFWDNLTSASTYF